MISNNTLYIPQTCYACQWDIFTGLKPVVPPLFALRTSQIAKFMGPTWGPPGSCRPQMGPMLAPWTLLSGVLLMPAGYELSTPVCLHDVFPRPAGYEMHCTCSPSGVCPGLLGPVSNIRTVFPRCEDSHVKDKPVGETVLPLTWESLYW